MMRRQITIIGLLALIFISFISYPAYTAYANEEERLQIKVEAGLEGKAKEGQGYPVTLTVTNHQEDFNGELIITFPAFNKVLPVDIASGATKSLSFSLPAMQEMGGYPSNPNNEKQFRLYEGNWEDGKEVSIDPNLDISPTFIQPDKLVIGLLSDRPDSLNYVKLTTFSGNSPEVINLEESMIPADPQGLDVLDLLIMNDYAITQWAEEKQDTLKAWVQKGGTLITGSEPGLDQKFGKLAEMLPLTITGQENMQQIQGFTAFYEEPLQAEDIELFTGEMDEEAAVLYKEDSIPLIVDKPYGKGTVTQVMFDLGLPVLSDWEGSALLWQSLGANSGQMNPAMQGMGMRTVDRLADIARTFPTLANLKVSTLAILFIVYLLVVVPVLYLILKRLDKREWAWIFVPVLAIVASVGLYAAGAKDRGGGIKTNTVSVISVDEQGTGSGKGAVAMLSKGSGAYTLSMKKELDPLPAEEWYGPQQPYSELPFVQTGGNNATVHFQQVEFWSPRSVAIDYPVKEYGSFTSTFTLDNGTISGEITNQFDFDFQSVYLISGQNYQEIGELAAGESREIRFDPGTKNFFERPTEQVAYQLFSPSGQINQENDDQLNRELLSVAIQNELDSNVNAPMLIGFTNKSLYPVRVNEEETNENHLQLFMQPAGIHLAEGEMSSITTEINLPQVTVNEGQIYHNGIVQGDPFIDTSSGSFLLTYELPLFLRQQPFTLEELTIHSPNRRNGLAYSLYNVQTGAYDPIDQMQVSFEENADEKYLQDDAIVLKVSTPSDGAIEVPTVTLEGVINP